MPPAPIDYLHALGRSGGNSTEALTSLGMSKSAVKQWRSADPPFADAETAVLAWLESADARVRPIRRPAPDDVLNRAAELIEEGAGITSAAKAVGVSYQTLRYRASGHPRLAAALTSRPRKWNSGKISPQQDAALQRLWADEQLSIRQIAQQLGVSQRTVSNWIHRLALPSRGRARSPYKASPEANARLRELSSDGVCTAAEIAAELGVSVSTVHRWRRRLGLPKRGHDPGRKTG